MVVSYLITLLFCSLILAVCQYNTRCRPPDKSVYSKTNFLISYDMQIDGKRGAGRPKQTWKKLTEKDCREWKLTTVDPQERSTWRSGVRSAMRAASQLPEKRPTDVDDAPAPAR